MDLFEEELRQSENRPTRNTACGRPLEAIANWSTNVWRSV